MNDRWEDEYDTFCRQSPQKAGAELHYLVWMRYEMDFGPAHSDVVDIMHERYEKETGQKVPRDWRQE